MAELPFFGKSLDLEKTPKKQWSDLSTGQQVSVVVLAVVQVGLLVAALWDLSHRSKDQIRGPKFLWYPLVFVNYVGPIAYFTLGRS